jgi:hypothetical protein
MFRPRPAPRLLGLEKRRFPIRLKSEAPASNSRYDARNWLSVSSRTGRNVPTESSGRTWGSTLRRSHVIADALNATKEATDTISITAGAYEAIKGSLPGQRGSPPPADPDGLIRVWLAGRTEDSRRLNRSLDVGEFRNFWSRLSPVHSVVQNHVQ